MFLKIALLAAALTFSSSLRALDLTPSAGSRELEGIEIPIVLFSDGARKVAYQPPGAWRLSSDSGELLRLYPPNASHAVMQFRIRPRSAAAEEPEAWARALLPEDAAEATLSGRCESPFTMDGLGSTEITFSYTASGRRFLTSVASVDLNEQQKLAVIVTAGFDEFNAVHDAAISSLFSWTWRD